jgi:hypothetical protein
MCPYFHANGEKEKEMRKELTCVCGTFHFSTSEKTRCPAWREHLVKIGQDSTLSERLKHDGMKNVSKYFNLTEGTLLNIIRRNAIPYHGRYDRAHDMETKIVGFLSGGKKTAIEIADYLHKKEDSARYNIRVLLDANKIAIGPGYPMTYVIPQPRLAEAKPPMKASPVKEIPQAVKEELDRDSAAARAGINMKHELPLEAQSVSVNLTDEQLWTFFKRMILGREELEEKIKLHQRTIKSQSETIEEITKLLGEKENQLKVARAKISELESPKIREISFRVQKEMIDNARAASE